MELFGRVISCVAGIHGNIFVHQDPTDDGRSLNEKAQPSAHIYGLRNHGAFRSMSSALQHS